MMMVEKSMELLNTIQLFTALKDLIPLMLRDTSKRKELLLDIQELKTLTSKTHLNSCKRNAISFYPQLLRNPFTKETLTNSSVK